MLPSNCDKNVERINGACNDSVHCSSQYKEQEVPVVAFAHTIAYPRTVVVVDLYTGIAVCAVEGPRRLIDFASPTHVDANLMTLHFSKVLKSTGWSRTTFLLEY